LLAAAAVNLKKTENKIIVSTETEDNPIPTNLKRKLKKSREKTIENCELKIYIFITVDTNTRKFQVAEKKK
jgi:hypothetical protein